VSRLRDDPTEFEDAIDAAARALGLAPLFVEKDYWVTQVLRALNTRHSGWFVFKGGTSLSKGYGLIERFSEDVDILVSPAKDDSARTREELLLAMTESVGAELALEWQQGRAPGRGRMAHRADVLVYPRTVRGSTVVPMEDRGVLLETGFAGGCWPILRLLTTRRRGRRWKTEARSCGSCPRWRTSLPSTSAASLNGLRAGTPTVRRADRRA
jgi:hypothetical protein